MSIFMPVKDELGVKFRRVKYQNNICCWHFRWNISISNFPLLGQGSWWLQNRDSRQNGRSAKHPSHHCHKWRGQRRHQGQLVHFRPRDLEKFHSVFSMQISDSVVQRLKDELAAPGSSQQKEEQPPSPEPPKAENPPQPPPSQPPPAPEAAAQQKPPVIQYVERESSMTSLRVRAEKERELAEAEAYWRRRFVKQEQEV